MGARAVAGGEGRDRADPDQLADVRRGQAADLPGHRHRQRVRQGGHQRPLGHEALPAGDGRRGRAARLRAGREPAARLDRRGSPLRPEEHRRQHAGRGARRAGRGRHRRRDGRGERRRLREQVDARDAESVRLARRLGARDRARNGRRLVPARHARHRRRRHGRQGHGPREGIADGPDRHARAARARAVLEARGAAHRAVREGQRARDRRPGPRRAHDRARREDPHLPDARGVEAGRDDPELRGDAARALRARRQRAGRARPAVARPLARRALEAVGPVTAREPRCADSGGSARLEAGADAAAVGPDAHRARCGAQAAGRDAQLGPRTAARASTCAGA